jgi:hypothetical protein
MRTVPGGAALAAVVLAAAPLAACSLCGDMRSRQTMRQEATAAKMILYGTLANPRPSPSGRGGETDIKVEHVIKDNPVRAGRKSITMPRYVPVNADAPPKFLIFCDTDGKRLDPYRGDPVRSDAVVAYLKGALALPADDRDATLLYFFRHIDSADPEVAADAFLEFAKATDAEVARVAPKLDRDKLRRSLTDPKTPPERLGLFAFLLASCGDRSDAALLLEMLDRPSDRTRTATNGLLAGYIVLDPARGWKRAAALLSDGKRPFNERYAVVSALRFLRSARPTEYAGAKDDAVRCARAALAQPDTADLVIDDLRRWQWWELTPDVLATDGRAGYDSPLMRRTLVRYALCCPRPEAAAFIAGKRGADPDLVQDVKEGLEFEARSNAAPPVNRPRTP